MRKNFNQIAHLPAFWILTALIAAGIVSNLATGQSGETFTSRTNTSNDAGKILREGTRLESRRAICRMAGDRLLIELVDESRQVMALENLASQRVLKAVMDDASDSKWIVSGLVTEFQDRNFLMLDRVARATNE